MKYFSFVLLLVAGCSTAQVQDSCREAQELAALVAAKSPPKEMNATAALLATVCQSPQYAAFRERIVTWLRAQK